MAEDMAGDMAWHEGNRGMLAVPAAQSAIARNRIVFARIRLLLISIARRTKPQDLQSFTSI
jgi:hypothetical protein